MTLANKVKTVNDRTKASQAEHGLNREAFKSVARRR